MESPSTTTGAGDGSGPGAHRVRQLLARLDPRRHLTAAIGWAVLAVVALASLIAGNLAAADAEQAARAATQRLMAQFATQVQDGLQTSLQTRSSIVQATAAQIAASGDLDPQALQRHLIAVQARFPEFAWVGVADEAGRIVSATVGGPRGGSLAPPPAASGDAGAAQRAGDVRREIALEERLSSAADGATLRFVDATAPIRRSGGDVAGVVVARLGWDWIERLHRDLAASLDPRRELQVMLIGRGGEILAGPAPWVGRTLARGDDLTEGGRYLVGRTDADARDDVGLGWTVAVRQSTASALAEVRRLHRTVLFTVLLAGVLAAAAALVLTRWLTRRLEVLAGEAQAVRQGRRSDLAAPAGDDEVSRIGAAMAELVGHLQREKAALERLNAELDVRVAERTARIERMADEARHAAVTRERLRLARDLHDTLAHSLMALLQQIRLVRKLKGRWTAEEFDVELARAEEVAAAGLAEARAAITQMRHGTVREIGLSAALRELLARFGERTGVRTSFAATGAAADLADERAEVLYRVVEEALRNIERHARAASVAVTIADRPGGADAAGACAALEVRDDGVGFDPGAAHPGHFGLQGMREQAALIGARFEVDSGPGRGSVIRLEFEP